jgi:mono/diheme cytochrome c family protein
VLCHGAPGLPPQEFAKGLEPGAPPLAQAGREWQPQELYWVIRHGIKMTAMPAWEYRLADSDLWALVAFLRVLPRLSPAEYQTMLASQPKPQKLEAEREIAASARGGDATRGKTAFHQYACHMCHQAPGISGPQAHVGPPLQGTAQRRYIAGVLENTPENMMLWIQHPQAGEAALGDARARGHRRACARHRRIPVHAEMTCPTPSSRPACSGRAWAPRGRRSRAQADAARDASSPHASGGRGR